MCIDKFAREIFGFTLARSQDLQLHIRQAAAQAHS
jgi:hypothetical protein